MPVVRHFPGLGGATGNTYVTPASTPPWSTLERVGLVPFENCSRRKASGGDGRQRHDSGLYQAPLYLPRCPERVCFAVNSAFRAWS